VLGKMLNHYVQPLYLKQRAFMEYLVMGVARRLVEGNLSFRPKKG
jgi:hypothetical protein